MALQTAGWDLDVGRSDASEEDFKTGEKWINRSMMNWVFTYVDNCFEYSERELSRAHYAPLSELFAAHSEPDSGSGSDRELYQFQWKR